MIRNSTFMRAFASAEVVSILTVIMLFVGMFTAAVLDTQTALGSGVWLGIWFTMTFIPLMLTAFHFSHPAARIGDNTVDRYFALPKADKARFPRGTKEALLNRDAPDWYDTRNAVEAMLDEIAMNNRETSANGDIIKQIREARADLAVHTETLRELR